MKFKLKKTNDIKQTDKSFADGLNIYKLFWIFVIFSVGGVFIETIWGICTTGTIESKQGLIYGPFSQIYGLGAMLMIIILNPIKKKSITKIFLYSAIIGACFEYICSYVQENAFGSTSWEYSKMLFNINGRINLLYTIFWGVLGVVLINYLFPKINKLIESIPNKPGKIITWILVIFLSFDVFITIVAVRRESERIKNIPANNKFEQFLDEKYPDSYMEKIFPKMEFK